ncbi:MAG: hypothetical protein ACRDFW_05590, partial [bacterium]
MIGRTERSDAGVRIVTEVISAASTTLFRFSVKWRASAPRLCRVPPLRGGDFQGMGRSLESDVKGGGRQGMPSPGIVF